jgi:hypothetical protein
MIDASNRRTAISDPSSLHRRAGSAPNRRRSTVQNPRLPYVDAFVTREAERVFRVDRITRVVDLGLSSS